MSKFLNDLNFFLLPLGFGTKRMKFFENRIENFGGNLTSDNLIVTHVLIEDTVIDSNKNFCCLTELKNNKMNFIPNGKYLKVSWLSDCLNRKNLVDTKNYEIDFYSGVKKEKNIEINDNDKEKKFENIFKKGEKFFDNEIEPETFSSSSSSSSSSPRKKSKIEKLELLRSVPSSSSIKKKNKLIIEQFEKLENVYAVQNDTRRSFSYKRAISAISLYDKEIKTFQEACSIPGVGKKMALKIMEVLETGKIDKLENLYDEKTKILNIFCNVWGAGPSTAEIWYNQGLRNLNDLKERGKLTKRQEIGLKLYYDLLERIPREEVFKIFEIVKKCVTELNDSLTVELVGSYRRGKETCGDVDIMVVNDGIKSPGQILNRLGNLLKTQGFLTDDLVNFLQSEKTYENHRKYYGIFKLPGDKEKHRRLDIFIVPKNEYVPALFHYTGSAMFNRTIKLVACKKNMILTERGLYTGTVRKGSEVISKGQLIITKSENDIFKELELPYRLPEERDY